MPIKSLKISGRSTQETRSGKNKLSYNYYDGNSKTINGITFTVNKDRSITANGTATANATFDMVDINSYAITAGSYKLVGENSKYTKAAIRGSYKKTDGTIKYLSSVSDFIIEEGSTDVYFYVVILQGETVNNVTFYPMLLNSTETDLTFEAGGASPSPDFPSEIQSIGDEGTVEIKQSGKNYINPNQSINEQLEGDNYSSNKSSFTNISTNQITSYANYFGWGSKGLVFSNLPQNTDMTISGILLSTTGDTPPCILIRGIKNETITTIKFYELPSKNTNTEFSYKFNTNDYDQIFFGFNGRNVDKSVSITSIFDYVQLEVGDKTPYEPNFSNSYVLQTEPLRSLPNGTKDTIEADGIHKRVRRKIFDGTENWTALNKTYYTPIADKRRNKEEISNALLSNQFKQTPLIDSSTTLPLGKMTETFYANNGNINVFFNYDDGIGGVNNWKDYLAEQYANGTPVYVDYELAEEVIEPLDEEQKEEIDSITTYKGTTYLTNSDNAEMEIEYYKDLQTLFDKVVSE